MDHRTEIRCGKQKIFISREATGVDKTREAILYIMKGYEWKDSSEVEN